MNRRDLLALVGAAAVIWPCLAAAQQKTMPVIGILGAVSPEVPGVRANLAALRRGLADIGYVEGQNVAFEYRWAERQFDRLRPLAAELVSRRVDVIVTEGGDSTTQAAKNATSTIPIVFHGGGDPVALGIVASLARPGGNLTGVNMQQSELIPKLLELLLEVVPRATLIGLLHDPASPFDEANAARARGIRLYPLPVYSPAQVHAAFASLLERQIDGLIINSFGRNRLAELALQHHLPAISVNRDFAYAGGLLSYGASLIEAYRIKGLYAGRILKGEKPAELLVVQPTKFELVINLKTARALGLTMPPSLLGRADEVIE